MPYVTVKMLEGRTEEQKKALAEKVTAAVSETTGAPRARFPLPPFRLLRPLRRKPLSAGRQRGK